MAEYGDVGVQECQWHRANRKKASNLGDEQSFPLTLQDGLGPCFIWQTMRCHVSSRCAQPPNVLTHRMPDQYEASRPLPPTQP